MKFTLSFLIIFLFWPVFASAAPSRIYAARVGTSGAVIGAPIEVAPFSTGVQEGARIAFFNGTFLVVWQDLRNGVDDDVLAVRILADGTVLDSTPISIATGVRTQAMPDVDADDEGFMVVWHGFAGSDNYPHVYAARVGTDGSVGMPASIAKGSSPRIAWNGTNHLVAYASTYNTTFRRTRTWIRITKTPVILSQAGLGFMWQAQEPAIPNYFYPCAMPPATGKGWTIIASEGAPNFVGGMGVIRAINITADGIIEPTSPTAASPAFVESTGAANWLDWTLPPRTMSPQGATTAAPDGQYCIAVWQRYHLSGNSLVTSDLYAARVNGWKPVDSPGVEIVASTADERNSDLAGNGSGTMLLAYEKMAVDGSMTNIAARLLTIGTSINTGSEVTIMTNGPGGIRRAKPAVAYGTGSANEFMVVWQEGWHGDSTVTVAGPDTNPPVITSGSPIGQLSAGTTQKKIVISASDASTPITCKWDTSDKSYASMTHTSGDTLTGLSNGSSHTIYARCTDSANPANVNTSSYSWTFTVGTQKTYSLSDFTQLVSDWKKTVTGLVSDVNSDNVVNARDLGVMMSGWE